MSPQTHLTTVLAIQKAVHDKKCDQPAKGHPAAATAGTAAEEVRLALWALRCNGASNGVARAACGALQDLLRTEQDCHAAAEADAVPVLIATLLRHGATPAVMIDGMSALWKLSIVDRAQAQLLCREALLPLVGAIRQHKAQGEVLTVSLALLAQLSATKGRKGRSALFAAHAMELALDAMLTHPRNAIIQCRGCELIHYMADGLVAQGRLLSMGAVEMVVEAVRQLPRDKKLLQRALPTLGRLCEAEQTRTIIRQIGGEAALVYAVDCNCDNLLIAKYGCTLLWELTSKSPMQRLFTPMPAAAAAGAKVLVKKALHHHPQDTVLLTYGPALLRAATRSLSALQANANPAPSLLDPLRQALAALSPCRP